MSSLIIDPFLYTTTLIFISFVGFIYSNNLHRRLIFSFIIIFSSVAILDLKILESGKITDGINILIYIVPLLVSLVLTFEQFKRNLKGEK